MCVCDRTALLDEEPSLLRRAFAGPSWGSAIPGGAWRPASQQLRTELNAANRPLLEEQLRIVELNQNEIYALKRGFEDGSPPLPPLRPGQQTFESPDITVHLRIEQLYTALCDLFDAEERSLVKVVLTNGTGRAQPLRASVEIQQYSTRADRPAILAPGESATLRLLPPLVRAGTAQEVSHYAVGVGEENLQSLLSNLPDEERLEAGDWRLLACRQFSIAGR